jgi:hypothetical protein
MRDIIMLETLGIILILFAVLIFCAETNSLNLYYTLSKFLYFNKRRTNFKVKASTINGKTYNDAIK